MLFLKLILFQQSTSISLGGQWAKTEEPPSSKDWSCSCPVNLTSASGEGDGVGVMKGQGYWNQGEKELWSPLAKKGCAVRCDNPHANWLCASQSLVTQGFRWKHSSRKTRDMHQCKVVVLSGACFHKRVLAWASLLGVFYLSERTRRVSGAPSPYEKC